MAVGAANLAVGLASCGEDSGGYPGFDPADPPVLPALLLRDGDVSLAAVPAG